MIFSFRHPFFRIYMFMVSLFPFMRDRNILQCLVSGKPGAEESILLYPVTNSSKPDAVITYSLESRHYVIVGSEEFCISCI